MRSHLTPQSMMSRLLLIALACALCVLPAGSATGAARSEVTIAPSADGEGVAFSGTVPSAKPGQRVVLEQRRKGRYRPIARTAVRGKRRAFGDLDTGPLPVGIKRRYRIVSGGRRLWWPKVRCLRSPVTGDKVWIIHLRSIRFVLPYPESHED